MEGVASKSNQLDFCSKFNTQFLEHLQGGKWSALCHAGSWVGTEKPVAAAAEWGEGQAGSSEATLEQREPE